MDGYGETLADIAAALDDLTADLEDLRDEMLEQLEAAETPELRADFARADEALNALYQAASLLEDE